MSGVPVWLPQSSTPRSINPGDVRDYASVPHESLPAFASGLAAVRNDGGEHKAALTKRYLEDQAIVGEDGFVPASEICSEICSEETRERQLLRSTEYAAAEEYGEETQGEIRIAGEMRAGECVEILSKSGRIQHDATIRWQRVGPQGGVELIENARGVRYVCQDVDVGSVLRVAKYSDYGCEIAIADRAVLPSDETVDESNEKRKEIILPEICLGPSSEAHKLFLRGKSLEIEAQLYIQEEDEAASTEKAKEALKCYVMAAEERYVPAYCSIGRMYELGIGMKCDYEQARGWYKEGVKADCGMCCNNFGVLEYLELGIGADRESAPKWFKTAAIKGNTAALNNLALCYEEGVGVEQSFTDARNFYEMAARSGVMSAYISLGYTELINGKLDDALDAFNAGLESGNPEAAQGVSLLSKLSEKPHNTSDLNESLSDLSRDVIRMEMNQFAKLSRGLYDIIMSGNSNSLKKQANCLLAEYFPSVP